MSLQEFHIQVPDAVLVDLKQRLSQTRWPDELPEANWDYGTNLSYLQQLTAYWQESFDWRAQERFLNAWPQFKATVDGIDVHFVHVRGKGENSIPLLLLHGWPGSFFEMYKVIGPLTDPARYGGNPNDSFDVIVPSLPGHGFSGPTRERGVNNNRIAAALVRLMKEELGYQRFLAQGGDAGSVIATRLGAAYPEAAMGIHINMVAIFPGPDDTEDTPEFRRWREGATRLLSEGLGYYHLQTTRPQTLAYGLNDSPAGLAGWIVEKFYEWSDNGGNIENVFTKDELLTNVMIYWVTQTINSSTRLYYESYGPPLQQAAQNADVADVVAMSLQRVEVPTAVAMFPHELLTPPRSVVARQYNVQQWTDMERGGHFAALEQPQALVEDIRAFGRRFR